MGLSGHFPCAVAEFISINPAAAASHALLKSPKPCISSPFLMFWTNDQ
ncbi:hypothetical protein APV28_4455 [Comamonas testosteroni]|nr:hypothetical protein APV28_4455 [Comamonas testosteroni]